MGKLIRRIGRTLFPKSHRCPKEEQCLELVRLMLDEESSSEDDRYVLNHIDNCYRCFDNYNLEKEIRIAVKEKTKNLNIPAHLVTEIKQKINSL